MRQALEAILMTICAVRIKEELQPVHTLPYFVPIDRRSENGFINTEREMEQLIERGRWLRSNVGLQEIMWDFNVGEIDRDRVYYCFADESHAMAFKIVWGEE